MWRLRLKKHVLGYEIYSNDIVFKAGLNKKLAWKRVKKLNKKLVTSKSIKRWKYYNGQF
jgi:hypothetical protein